MRTKPANNNISEALKLKFTELNKQELPLYTFLVGNKQRIIKVLEASSESAEKIRKEGVLLEAIYSNTDALADDIIKISIYKKRQIALLYQENKIEDVVRVKLEYAKLLLYYLQEKAFYDGVVVSIFDFFRILSLSKTESGKIRNGAHKIIKDLLAVLSGDKIISIENLSIEEWCTKIATLSDDARDILGMYIKQKQDSHRNAKERSAAINFSDDGVIYPNDKIFPSMIRRANVKRPFHRAKLPVKDEAILTLHLTKMSNADIGRLFSISGEAIRKKIANLWQKPTVRRAWEEKRSLVINDLEESEIGKTTQKEARYDKSELGKYIHEITPLLVNKFKVERRQEVSPATTNRGLACLKCMFNKAKEWGKFNGDNPVVKVKCFKENNQRVRFLEREEIDKLLANSNEPLRSIIIVALNTGMRKGEILGLKWRDCDFQRDLIRLTNTKNNEGRTMPMNEEVKTALIRVRKHPDSPFIFCNKEGKPYGDIKKSFFTALKKAGIIQFHFHDLRYTFASHLVMSGVDLNTVRELMGHKSLAMTIRYSHLSPDHKRRAVDLLSHRIVKETPKSSDFLVTLAKSAESMGEANFSNSLVSKQM
ncbi:MAG: site-specific integrase [Candidatus Omnitrophota bacterium]